VEDLAGLDTVAQSAANGRVSWCLEGPGGARHTFQHEPRYLADDLLTLKFAVVEGVGASMLPDYMCKEDLEAGRLVEVLPGWGPPAGILHAVFPSRRALVPAIRKLIDFLAEHIGAGGFNLTL